MKIYTGSYIGDGQTSREIKLPISPAAVIVKRDGASSAVWATSLMTAGKSSFFGPTADITNGIISIGVNKFLIGSNAAVNTTGDTYNYVAFEAESGDIEVGRYIGDQVNGRVIDWSSSHSAGPRLMFVKEEDSADPTIMRDFDDSGDSSTSLTDPISFTEADLISSMNSVGFAIGDDTRINETSKNYNYFAIFADSDHLDDGSYTGDSNEGHVIDAGVETDFVIVRNTGTPNDIIFRTRNMLGDKSYPLVADDASTSGLIENIYGEHIQLGDDAKVNGGSTNYLYFAFKVVDWSVSSKYHVSIDQLGYVLQSNNNGRILYEKKPAPEFVSKFGSGDSSYRDSSFWQFWAQVNWRNGAKQLRFDDAGKFWKSQNIDVTQLERFRLSRKMSSYGQVAAGTKVTAQAAFRSSQSWWDANYGYRKQLTITAPVGKQLPVGYPIRVTEDTAALQTASKVRSDRKDWRIVYWNGSTWVDLKRHYVATNKTLFGLQTAISAGAVNNDYYLYYGYASESTSQQPTTDAEWNQVYGLYGGASTEAVDGNTLAIWHCKEGTGSNIADTDSSHELSSNGMNWDTAGAFGYHAVSAAFHGEDQAAGFSSNAGSETDVGSFTIEFFANSVSWGSAICNYGKDSDTSVKFKIEVGNNLSVFMEKRTSSSNSQSVNSGDNYLLNDGVNHHYAIAFDGSNTAYFYRDNVLFTQRAFGGTNGIRSVTGRLFLFRINTVNFSHVRLSNTARSSFPYVTLPSEFTVESGTEQTTQPPASSFSHYVGLSNGDIYLSDGAGGWTLVFSTRRLTWYDSGDDGNGRVGDTGGTEYKRWQSFQLGANTQVKALELLMKAVGTPTGDITVRIETNNAGVPSGTLAHANATTTIPNFTDTTAAWKAATFANSFPLSGSTVYHIVVSCDAQADDTGWELRLDASSPTYTGGQAGYYTPSTYTAESGKDSMFRILGEATSINCAIVTSVGGTQKILWGIGDIASEVNGNARVISFDGSIWKLEKTFVTATESQVLSLVDYEVGGVPTIFASVGPQGRIYKTTDLSSWTLSDDVDKPQNPGYAYSLYEYNKLLYAGGGSPEFLDDKYYNGFFRVFNQVDWEKAADFDHTVLKSMQFYDAFLFLGSYHGDIFVFNTVTLDPLFSFRDDYDYQVQVASQYFFDDKLWIGLAPQNGIAAGNEDIWLFNRHGMHAANRIADVNGYYSFIQVNNDLFVGTGDEGYVYKRSNNLYEGQGHLQTSYFDALLPSINKLYNEFVIQYDPLPAGCSINVYYKFKESDDWTQLGTTINTQGSTSSTLSFNSGIYSKKISFKIELITSDPSVSPTINEYVLKYSLYPARKWQWNLRVLAKDYASLLDASRDPRTGLQIATDITEAQQALKLNTYVDIDGKSYSVLFHTLDQDSWVINQDKEGAENSIAITLLEA